ncbi:MAG: hypothetical protein Q9P01_12475 [Anaerolineae bacterium]|nr:hypothetical protein [Anaerolineae bacterium]
MISESEVIEAFKDFVGLSRHEVALAQSNAFRIERTVAEKRMGKNLCVSDSMA